jgi:hypothetical protein
MAIAYVSSRSSSGPLTVFDDARSLADFTLRALSDPRAAAQSLATRLDILCTHHEGDDLARALDNWAFDLDPDWLDALSWYATLERLDHALRCAVSAILVGATERRETA